MKIWDKLSKNAKTCVTGVIAAGLLGYFAYSTIPQVVYQGKLGKNNKFDVIYKEGSLSNVMIIKVNGDTYTLTDSSHETSILPHKKEFLENKLEKAVIESKGRPTEIYSASNPDERSQQMLNEISDLWNDCRKQIRKGFEDERDESIEKIRREVETSDYTKELREISLKQKEIETRSKLLGYDIASTKAVEGCDYAKKVIEGYNYYLPWNNKIGKKHDLNPRLLAYLQLLECDSTKALEREKTDDLLKYYSSLGFNSSDMEIGENTITLKGVATWEKGFYERKLKDKWINNKFYNVWRNMVKASKCFVSYPVFKKYWLSTSCGPGQVLYMEAINMWQTLEGHNPNKDVFLTIKELCKPENSINYQALHTKRGLPLTDYDYRKISRYHVSGNPDGPLDPYRERREHPMWKFVHYKT